MLDVFEGTGLFSIRNDCLGQHANILINFGGFMVRRVGARCWH